MAELEQLRSTELAAAEELKLKFTELTTTNQDLIQDCENLKLEREKQTELLAAEKSRADAVESVNLGLKAELEQTKDDRDECHRNADIAEQKIHELETVRIVGLLEQIGTLTEDLGQVRDKELEQGRSLEVERSKVKELEMERQSLMKRVTFCAFSCRFSNRPRHSCCPSLHSSVCLSDLVWAPISKTKRHRKSQIGVNVSQGRSNCCANCLLERSVQIGLQIRVAPGGRPHNMSALFRRIFCQLFSTFYPQICNACPVWHPGLGRKLSKDTERLH